ncbi:hypothetical protein AAU61_16985 [Desulfocarbo indianensis]|nr:hypothetical protein AAU61_16985 [Desulfocarbo indianensis]
MNNGATTVLALGISLLMGPFLLQAIADDHRDKKTHKARELAAPANKLYTERCGGCHLAYPTVLLPSASWRRILTGQSDHFGEDLSLGQLERQELLTYLDANAADKSSSKISRKIMKSLRGQAPLRITEIPYIIHKHKDDDVPKGAFQRKSVGSFANCGACHPRAADGDFDDDDVKIPAQ